MSNISATLANEILNHLFGKMAFSAPANIFVQLSTTQPTDTGGNVTPPTGGLSGRVQTAPSDWSAALNRSIANANAITFPQANGASGDIGYFAFYDAGVNGNFLGWGVISNPQEFVDLDTPYFDVGQLTISG